MARHLILVLLVAATACKEQPARTIGVDIETGHRPVMEAMRIWNSAIGCNAFVVGNDVRYMSTDGEPCGLLSHPEISDGHSATSYRCGKENRGWKWEVHVSRPGNIRTQVCIALHELGHVAGLPDSSAPTDLMSPRWCPPDGVLLWPRDAESRTVGENLCHRGAARPP